MQSPACRQCGLRGRSCSGPSRSLVSSFPLVSQKHVKRIYEENKTMALEGSGAAPHPQAVRAARQQQQELQQGGGLGFRV